MLEFYRLFLQDILVPRNILKNDWFFFFFDLITRTSMVIVSRVQYNGYQHLYLRTPLNREKNEQFVPDLILLWDFPHVFLRHLVLYKMAEEEVGL